MVKIDALLAYIGFFMDFPSFGDNKNGGIKPPDLRYFEPSENQ